MPLNGDTLRGAVCIEMHLEVLPNWQPSHFGFDTAPHHLHEQRRPLSGEEAQVSNRLIAKDSAADGAREREQKFKMKP